MQTVDTFIMLLSLVAFPILTHTILATPYFERHIKDWLVCESVDEPFFTRWNIALPECVETCARRSRCRAVSYNKPSKRCGLLNTEKPNSVRSTSNTSCAYIKKMDMLIPEEIAYGCQNCSLNKTCDMNNTSCIITECLPLEVANATVFGNMVNVSSGIKIVANAGYILSTNQSKSKCRENGTWSNVPTSILADCGDTPTVSNAIHTGSNTSIGSQIGYACADGYDVNGSTAVMTIDCELNTNSTPTTIEWSPVLFQCIGDCGDPPTVLNAIHTGSNTSLGSQIGYACIDGYGVNDSTAVMTIDCELNTSSTPTTIEWSPVLFQCIGDCGDPPIIPYATHSGSNTSRGSQIGYACIDGYGVNDSTAVMTINCELNTSSTPTTINWSTVLFQCIEVPCPTGWIEREQSCYMVSDDTRTQDGAMLYCNNLVERIILRRPTQLGHHNIRLGWWIGIDDKDNEDVWVYTHTKEIITFTDWLSGEPNNYGGIEHCAVIIEYNINGYGWLDLQCGYSYRFICEKRK